jgi:hypothetical protein
MVESMKEDRAVVEMGRERCCIEDYGFLDLR